MIYIYKWDWKDSRVIAYGVSDEPAGPIRTLSFPAQSFILLEPQENAMPLPGLTHVPGPWIEEYTGTSYPQGLYKLENGPHLPLDSLYDIGCAPQLWHYASSFLNEMDYLHRYFMLKQYPYYSGWFEETETGELLAVPDKKDPPSFTVLFYDLECVAGQEGRFPHELESTDAIISISLIKAILQGEEYTLVESTVLLVATRPENLSTATYRVRTFPTERALLQHVLTDHFRDPSLNFISGFNTSAFDDKFLAGRYYRYHQESSLTRYQYPFREDGLVSLWYTPQQLCLDVYKFYKQYFRYDYYSLDYLARHILGDAKRPMDHQLLRQILLSTDTIPLDQLQQALDYNFHDSWITLHLCRHAKLIEFTLTISATCFLNPERVILAGKSELLQGYICIHAYRLGYLVNFAGNDLRTPATARTTYEGAYVYLKRPGVYANVTVLDYRSLYPSIISAKNLSLSTCRESTTAPLTEQDQRTYDSVSVGPGRYCWSLKTTRGLFPLICERLLALRESLKTQLAHPDLPAPTYRYLSHLQLAIKIINNSLYGQLGAPHSLFYRKLVAEACTAHARNVIRQTRDYVESRGIPCLFIDTDSIFVISESQEHGRALTRDINACIGIPELSIVYECHYRTLFLYSKKKYYGLRDDGTYKSCGFEIKKRDFPQYCKPILEELLQLALQDEGDLLLAFMRFRDLLFRMDVGLQYHLFSKTLTLKPLYKYSAHCSAPHVTYVKRLKVKIARGEFVSLRYSPLPQHQLKGYGLSLVSLFSSKVVPVNLAQCVKGACVLFDKIYGIRLNRERFHYFKECLDTIQKYNLVVSQLACAFLGVSISFSPPVSLILADWTEERKRPRTQPSLYAYFTPQPKRQRH